MPPRPGSTTWPSQVVHQAFDHGVGVRQQGQALDVRHAVLFGEDRGGLDAVPGEGGVDRVGQWRGFEEAAVGQQQFVQRAVSPQLGLAGAAGHALRVLDDRVRRCHGCSWSGLLSMPDPAGPVSAAFFTGPISAARHARRPGEQACQVRVVPGQVAGDALQCPPLVFGARHGASVTAQGAGDGLTHRRHRGARAPAVVEG